MAAYLVLLFIVLICYVLTNQIGVKWSLRIALLPFFSLLGFKSYSVGTDTFNYINMFWAAKYGSFETIYGRLEIGYKICIQLLGKSGLSAQFQFIFVALLISISLGSFSKKWSSKPILVIFFYITLGLYSFNLTAIRQSIAMAICLFSFRYIYEKKIIYYLLIILIAMTFHKSAIFFAPAYFVANRRVNTFNLLTFTVFSMIIIVFSETIITNVSSIFDVHYGIERTNNGYIFLLVVFVITALSFVYRNQLLMKNPKNIFFFNLNLVSMMLWVMRLSSRTVERVSFYYLIASIIILTETIEVIRKDKERQFVRISAITLSFILFLYRLISSDIYPYVFS